MTTSTGQHTGTPIAQKDQQGTWTVGQRLGSGNEGEVYAIQNDPTYAVKIYHEGKRPGPQPNCKAHRHGRQNATRATRIPRLPHRDVATPADTRQRHLDPSRIRHAESFDRILRARRDLLQPRNA